MRVTLDALKVVFFPTKAPLLARATHSAATSAQFGHFFVAIAWGRLQDDLKT